MAYERSLSIDAMENDVIHYWKKKVEKVVEISNEYGYHEQNREFWERQPAGVISLIVDIHERKKE